MKAVSYSLRQTIFRILKTLVLHASQNNLDLTYHVSPNTSDQLISDLLGNMINFTPLMICSKGLIALSMCLFPLDRSSVSFEFCMLDTSIGKAKEKLNVL
jgi:hypothetical protein